MIDRFNVTGDRSLTRKRRKRTCVHFMDKSAELDQFGAHFVEVNWPILNLILILEFELNWPAPERNNGISNTGNFIQQGQFHN